MEGRPLGSRYGAPRLAERRRSGKRQAPRHPITPEVTVKTIAAQQSRINPYSDFGCESPYDPCPLPPNPRAKSSYYELCPTVNPALCSPTHGPSLPTLNSALQPQPLGQVFLLWTLPSNPNHWTKSPYYEPCPPTPTPGLSLPAMNSALQPQPLGQVSLLWTLPSNPNPWAKSHYYEPCPPHPLPLPALGQVFSTSNRLTLHPVNVLEDGTLWTMNPALQPQPLDHLPAMNPVLPLPPPISRSSHLHIQQTDPSPCQCTWGRLIGWPWPQCHNETVLFSSGHKAVFLFPSCCTQ